MGANIEKDWRVYRQNYYNKDPDRKVKVLERQKEYRRSEYSKDPEKFRQRQREYYRKNKEKIQAQQKVQRSKHREKLRAYNIRTQQQKRLKHKYGLTVDQFHKMLAAQNNRCAICLNEFKNTKDTHIDHDHATKKVRGLLCYRCNHGLGKFKDNPEVLIRAAEYINRHREA